MARPKTPTAIKVLKGTVQKCRENKNEATPERGIPDPPGFLINPVAIVRWHELAPELIRLGLLSMIDGEALACHCNAYAHLKEAEEDIAERGHNVQDRFGTDVPNPNLKVAATMMDKMSRFLSHFGMSPSTRAGVTAIKSNEKKNPFASLTGGNKRA